MASETLQGILRKADEAGIRPDPFPEIGLHPVSAGELS